MKFGNRQNQLNGLISKGVEHVSSNQNDHQNVNSEIAYEYYNNIDDDNIVHVDRYNDNNIEVEDANEDANNTNNENILNLANNSNNDLNVNDIDKEDNYEHDNNNTAEANSESINVAISDRDDAFPLPGEENVKRTRLGRISRPYDYAKHFPETAHFQSDSENSIWIKPYYYDDGDMVEKLGHGRYY